MERDPVKSRWWTVCLWIIVIIIKKCIKSEILGERTTWKEQHSREREREGERGRGREGTNRLNWNQLWWASNSSQYFGKLISEDETSKFSYKMTIWFFFNVAVVEAVVMGNYQWFWTIEVPIVEIIQLSVYLVVYWKTIYQYCQGIYTNYVTKVCLIVW